MGCAWQGVEMAYRAGFTKICFVDKRMVVKGGTSIVSPRYAHSFNRLLVFGFVHYSLVVYLDTDVYILQAGLVKGMVEQERRLRMDGKTLSCRKEIAHDYCNSGVLFIRPDVGVLDGLGALGRLCQAIVTDTPWGYRNVAGDIIPVAQGMLPRSRVCRHDQALLNAYFTVDSNNVYEGTASRDTLPLPSAYNTIFYEAHQAYGAWNMQDMRDMGVVVLHFVHPKPWTTWECNAWWMMGGVCQYWRDAPIEPSNETAAQPTG